MKLEIRKDILVCEKLLQKDFVEGKEFSNIIGKYRTKYPNFSDGFKNYAMSVGGRVPNQIENVKILKSKLEFLLVEIENPQLYENNNVNTTVNVSNLNSNNNTNKNYMNFTLDDARKNIEENTYISDKEREELLQKLEEIESLQKSKQSKNKKWSTAKEILKFILDKGADIAIMFIPQILKAIQ